jgi:hypothetical protein
MIFSLIYFYLFLSKTESLLFSSLAEENVKFTGKQALLLHLCKPAERNTGQGKTPWLLLPKQWKNNRPLCS